jgi:moderate conductance mechanosensitive channel
MFSELSERAINFFEGAASRVDDILITLLQIILIIVAGKILIWLINKIIKKVIFNKRLKKINKISDRKTNSIISLSKSVVKVIVWFMVIAAVLEKLNLGISASSLLATAGIGGVAIGFGAQDLVKDVVAGAFLFIEGQYEVGDFVELAGVRGTVEEINIRNTEVKAYTGELNIIPNGIIDKVINYSKGNNLAIIDIGVAYEEDIEKVSNSILTTAKAYKEINANVVGEPEYVGVVNLGDSDVVLRVIMEVKPATQWQIERDLRELIKTNFDKENIEIPYPKRVEIKG